MQYNESDISEFNNSDGFDNAYNLGDDPKKPQKKFKNVEEYRRDLAETPAPKLTINNIPYSKKKTIDDKNMDFVNTQNINFSTMNQANRTEYFPSDHDIKRSQQERDVIIQGLKKTDLLSPNLANFDKLKSKATADRKFRVRS